MVANDIQEEDLSGTERSRRNRPGHAGNRVFHGRRLPEDAQIEAAAAILNGAQRVAILAGRGALDAALELEETARILAAPVAKALLGKAVLPDDHPYTTGGIGILGTRASQDIMEQRISDPLKPQTVVRAFGERMADDAILTPKTFFNSLLATRVLPSLRPANLRSGPQPDPRQRPVPPVSYVLNPDTRLTGPFYAERMVALRPATLARASHEQRSDLLYQTTG